MAMTKSTTIVWASANDQMQPDLDAARSAKLQEMVADGKTDGEYEKINETTSKRHWLDQAAAEEFISFIMAQAELYNCNIVSTVIEDYQQPT